MSYKSSLEEKNEHLKCGEVFLDKQNFYFTCLICESIIEHKQDNFIEHLKAYHYDHLSCSIANKMAEIQQVDVKIEFTDPNAHSTEQIVNQIIDLDSKMNSEDDKLDSNFCEIEYLDDDVKFFCPIVNCKYEKNNKNDVFLHILEVHNLINRQGELFECVICQLKQTKRDFVNRHLKNKHGILSTIKIEDIDNEKYQCSLCKSNFCRKTNFTTHLRTFHKKYFNKLLVEQQEEYGKVNIKYANEFLRPNFSNAEIQLTFNDGIENKMEYISNGDEDSRSTIENIIVSSNVNCNIETDSISDSFPCPIDLCNESFKNVMDVVYHIRIEHEFIKEIDNAFCCALCDRAFYKDSIAKGHLRNKHGILMYLNIESNKNNNYPCDKCENNYYRKTDYNAHLRKKHYDYFIELITKQQQELYKNIPYYADIFKVPFEKHKNEIDVNEFACDLCIKKFSSQKFLTEHMKSHDVQINLLEKNNMFCCPIKDCQILCESKSEIFVHIFDKHDLVKQNENNYECSICEIHYTIKSLVDNHLKEKHGILPNLISYPSNDEYYVCALCNQKYKNIPTLNVHFKRSHIEYLRHLLAKQQNEYECKGIDMIYEATKNKMGNKNRLHTKQIRFSNGTSQWQCSQCDEKSAIKKIMIEHYNKTHSDILCNDCGFVLDSLDCIPMHSKVQKFDYDKFIKISDNDGLWHCKLCDETKPNKHLMISHYRNKHRNSSICDICGKKLSSPTSLVIHKRIHAEATFKCKFCPKAFQAEASYRFHTKIHLGQKDFNCSYCEKAFYRKYDLSMHEKMMHTKERSHVCDMCGQTFYTSTRLKYHIRRHTGERQYECDICNKFFYSNEARNKHKILHFDDRPFECPTCNAKFKSKKNLRVHKQSHSTVEKYSCPACAKSFAKYTSYYSHKKICKSKH